MSETDIVGCIRCVNHILTYFIQMVTSLEHLSHNTVVMEHNMHVGNPPC